MTDKNTTNETILFDALGIFLNGWRDYIVRKFKKEYGDDWHKKYRGKLKNHQLRMWDDVIKENDSSEYSKAIDFHNLKISSTAFRHILQTDFGKYIYKLPTWFDEIREVRNKCNHYQEFDKELDKEDLIVAYSHMIRIMKIIDKEQIVNQLESSREASNSPVRPVEKIIETKNDFPKTSPNTTTPKINETIDQAESTYIEVKSIPIAVYRNQDGKIQDCVKNVFATLFEKKLLSTGDIDNLLDNEYCKQTFKGLGFPLLRRESEGRQINGHSRYWKDVFGGEFFICSEWWKSHHAENFARLKSYLQSLG